MADTVRSAIAVTLSNRGYQVVPAETAPADAPRITVKVKEFWSYMPFNFGRTLTWTMQMKAWIASDVTVRSPGLEREFSVSGYGAHIVQVYDRDNIQKAYRIAMDDYVGKLESKLFSTL